MARNTGFYYDPIFLEHDTGSHPENVGRLTSILGVVEQDPLLEKLVRMAPRQATHEELELVHEAAHILRVEESALSEKGFLETPDCVVSQQTYQVALYAAGGIIDAVEQVSLGKLDNAFCASRPPGHHAERDMAMGFCFFNNIALAAQWLVKEKGMDRVLIVDFDVHHGNGTQHLFEDSNRVFYASIHQDPRTCYPGTGFADERGNSIGVGYTFNLPMAPYSDDEAYQQAFINQMMPKLEAFEPQFVLVSAGFDAHRLDPLAQQSVTVETFRLMTQKLMELADRFAEGRLVSLLEGGYHHQALAECVQDHLGVLLTNS